MPKPKQQPSDHPLEKKRTSNADLESMDISMSDADKSSDQIRRPNLEDIRTAGL